MWVIFLGWAVLVVLIVTIVGSVSMMIANKIRLKMLKDNKEAEARLKFGWVTTTGASTVVTDNK